jgi:hypothetical protein
MIGISIDRLIDRWMDGKIVQSVYTMVLVLNTPYAHHTTRSGYSYILEYFINIILFGNLACSLFRRGTTSIFDRCVHLIDMQTNLSPPDSHKASCVQCIHWKFSGTDKMRMCKGQKYSQNSFQPVSRESSQNDRMIARTKERSRRSTEEVTSPIIMSSLVLSACNHEMYPSSAP